MRFFALIISLVALSAVAMSHGELSSKLYSSRPTLSQAKDTSFVPGTPSVHTAGAAGLVRSIFLMPFPIVGRGQDFPTLPGPAEGLRPFTSSGLSPPTFA
jgi:hypothetical protein